MLEVPKLDDTSHGQMVREAVSRIPGMTGQWTDFNHHDPGVTVLSTYAWLVDMLNYYMDASGEEHLLKYLKLLGLHQQAGRHAQAYLGIQPAGGDAGECPVARIPRGMRVYAGDTCFEAAQAQEARFNPFRSYIREVDGAGMDLTAFAGADGEHAELFAGEFKECAIAYLGFLKELSGQVVLQACVEKNEGRAPFGDGFSMASLAWQYYGEGGWADAAVDRDLTNGFLRDGLIHLRLPGRTVPFAHKDGEGEAHYLRCILREPTYDVLPRLGGVCANPFLAEQKRTVSRREEVPYQGERELPLPFYVPGDASLLVGVQEGDKGGRLLYGGEPGEGQCLEIRDGRGPNEKVLAFPESQAASLAGRRLCVFCIEGHFLPEFRQGITDGCAGQEFPFAYPDLYEVEVSTWARGEDGQHRYEVWEHVPDLSKAGYMDQVFTYDPGQGKIRFGDGLHGKAPRQGQQLCITGLTASGLSRGNVRAGGVDRAGQADAPYRVSNLQAASGGREPETAQEMVGRLGQVLFAQQRLVSPADYVEAVRQTPGLLIESATVLPGAAYAGMAGGGFAPEGVVVVVKPRAKGPRPPLSQYYKEKILEHLEGRRLINTEVSVVGPAYVGIEVRGKVRLSAPGKAGQAGVLACLESMVLPGEGEDGFGKPVLLGRLHAGLEMLGQVRQVLGLSLERAGAGAVKGQRGDILLEGRALAYVKTIEIEFC